jgi:Transposase DDE domain group 1
MSRDLPSPIAHLAGEQSSVAEEGVPPGVTLDSFNGPVHVEWDRDASLTPLGQLPFFIDFLKASGLFEALVADCPLRYTSPNAPKKRDVLGTAMLSMLSGHKRYAHIAALRCDSVLPELLDMTKIVSEDAVRRAFTAINEEEGAAWLRRHLDYCVRELLSQPWVLDIDTTVKPLYGRQEGAAVGYNPKKPGRPSHSYHTYTMAGARLVLDVDVNAGDEHTSKHSAPGLWALLDRIPRDRWPFLLRGDAGFGVEAIMREAEARGLPYLFKLRLTKNVKRLIERLSGQSAWVEAGCGYEAKESLVRLNGWSGQRRAIVMRRRLKGALAAAVEANGQKQLSFIEIGAGAEVYEYCVLATSLDEELSVFGQLYRDRADAENIFDELKNQWGWGGFTTQDLARCRLAARLVALFYDWWSIFVRLAEPNRHLEAITSRPLLLAAIAARVRHARQTTLKVASSHAKAIPAAKALRAVALFLRALGKNAEQLTRLQIWRAILARAFQAFLQGRPLRLPLRLAPS